MNGCPGNLKIAIKKLQFKFTVKVYYNRLFLVTEAPRDRHSIYYFNLLCYWLINVLLLWLKFYIKIPNSKYSPKPNIKPKSYDNALI